MEAGWLVVAIGAVITVVSHYWLARANPTARLPILGRPPHTPFGAFALWILGVVLIVSAAASQAPGIGWVVLVVVLALVPAMVVQAIHNRKWIAQSDRG